MNADTHQQLERTETTSCGHDGIDVFCIKCILSDLERDDFRYELAYLTFFDLKTLAVLRAAADGEPWNEHLWRILDLASHKADLHSADPARRAAAERARDTIGDFLNNRRCDTYPQPRPLHIMRKQIAIVERTRARLDVIEQDGSADDLFGYFN